MKKSKLQEIIREELQNALNEIDDPAQSGFDDAMGRAGVTFATGNNSMRKYEVTYWYRYSATRGPFKDDKDQDSFEVTAKSEDEAMEKAKEKFRHEGIAVIPSSIQITRKR